MVLVKESSAGIKALITGALTEVEGVLNGRIDESIDTLFAITCFNNNRKHKQNYC